MDFRCSLNYWIPLGMLLASCGSSPTSLSFITEGEPPGISMVTPTDQVVLVSPLPSGLQGSQVIIEVLQPSYPLPTIEIMGQAGTAQFHRQRFSPAGLTHYRARLWDRSSSQADLGGVTQFAIPGIQGECVILRSPRRLGGQEITRSFGCQGSPPPSPIPTPTPTPVPTPIPTPPPTPFPTPTPPPGGEVLILDQISLTADSFFLAQTSDTGIVGFGPVSGPRALGDNFSGPGSSAFPDNGVRPVVCGDQVFFEGGFAPVLLFDQELGRFVSIQDGVLAPSTTLGVEQPNSITLSNQRLDLIQDANRRVTLQISPANFDEIYRLNFFDSREITFVSAICDRSDPEATLSFSETTVVIEEVLDSVITLFTLRGTTGGPEEPDQGILQGAQLTSDAPLAQGLVATADPRFAGVLNLRDVSGNPIRTDATLVFDQIAGQPTQGAIRQLPIGPGAGNPASGSPPFVTGSVQRDGQECLPDLDVVCGRFQLNQPFPVTEESDVLLITGTFVGRLR